MVKHYFIAGIIGAVITFVSLRSCQETPEPKTVKVVEEKWMFIHDTTIIGEGKGKTKFTFGGMLKVHDTILERVYITTSNGDTVSRFTATLDTIQNKDTLHLEYTYPESMFRYQLSRAPIEVKYTNTVTTNTVEIRPEWYEHPLFVSGTTAAVLVGIFGVVR